MCQINIDQNMFDISLNFSSIPEDEHPVEVSEYLASVL